MPSIVQILSDAGGRLALAAIEAPRLTTETLLCEVLSCERSFLYAHPEANLEPDQADRFRQLLERRLAGEPTQYLTGVQEFFGLEFEVCPAVFIPRPETELLVEEAIDHAPPAAKIVDIGTGSGCIAVSIATNRLDGAVLAVERSSDALEVARRNARLHAPSVRFVNGSLLEAFGEGSFDFVVSNPPYVAKRTQPTLQRELDFEPDLALFGGHDGLEVYRRLIPQALWGLKPGGQLALELGYDSLPGVQALLGEAWTEPVVRNDLAGIPRALRVSKR